MYTKLATQNMKKSIRNYVIYFVTITLTAAMMYSFLALGFSKEVLSMSENMSMLTSGILGMSVLVALIASFVISYAIRFMLEERKRNLPPMSYWVWKLQIFKNCFLLKMV